MSAQALEARGLHRRFGARVAVEALDLRVEAGEVVGLLGANGAGKTTTFRMLAGLLRPHAGEVRIQGREVTRWPLWRRARAGLGYLPQEPTIFRRLSVRQNVEVALPRAPDRRQRATAMIEMAGLSELSEALGRSLSGGERRRVEILRALAAQPTLLLVDEPFAALDPRSAQAVSEHLRHLAGEGIAVLLTDHDVRQSFAACDRAYILHHGA